MWLNSLVNVYWLFIVSLKHIKRLLGVTSQKMVIFLATTMRTSNLTAYRTVCMILLVTIKSLMSLTDCILMTSHIMVHADNVIFLSLCKDNNNWFPVNFPQDSAYILDKSKGQQWDVMLYFCLIIIAHLCSCSSSFDLCTCGHRCALNFFLIGPVIDIL